MKVIRFLDQNFERIILAILMIAMAFVMMLQIIMRYVFKSALSWPEEISRYMLVSMAFISLGYSTRYQQLTVVDSVIKAFPEKIYHGFVFFSKVCTLVFFCYMGYYSIPVFQLVIHSGQVSSALRFPMWIVYAMMPLGYALGTFRCIQNLLCSEILPRLRPKAENDGKEAEK